MTAKPITEAGARVLVPKAELDLLTCPRWHCELIGALKRKDCKILIVDFSQVEFFGATGLEDPTGKGQRRWSNRWKPRSTPSRSPSTDACPPDASNTNKKQLHQLDRPSKRGSWPLEVDALCLMCRAKLPPMCTGPAVSSASGLGIDLVCWAGF
jgi:hypothetical protein